MSGATQVRTRSPADGEEKQAAKSAGPDERRFPTLPRLALEFVKLGSIGFGGGLAVIALMERELVERRRLLPAEEFLHGVGLAQLLGPPAVNTSYFVGHRLFGPLGGALCAVGFLSPSLLLVIGLSWLYFTFHRIPALAGTIAGLGPVVIALILAAAWSMGRKALRSWPTVLVAAASFGASLLRISPVFVLPAAGLLGLVAGARRGGGKGAQAQPPVAPPPQGTPGTGAAAFVAPMAPPVLAATGLGGVVVTFFKIGLVFFGGGFVLVPVLHQRLVGELQWLSSQEFLDGVAISNLTPGPIAVLATFAGYRLHGVAGAVVATAALFLPAAVLMIVLCRSYDRLKDARRAKDFLAGVAPAVAALIAGAAVTLAPGALRSPGGWALLPVSLFLLVGRKWHPAFVLAVGALLGAAGAI